MPSHFSIIGFALESQEQLVTLARRVCAVAEPIRCGERRYLRWRGGSGEELWIQVNEDGALIGMNPHFSGKSALRVGLTRLVRRHDDTALDGAFHAWVDPDGPDPESGVYPFVFDCPDFAVPARLRLPAVVTVQITAFAHEVTVHASAAAHAASQAGQEGKLASRSFIPSGLFGPDMARVEPPEAFAILTGHVLESAAKENAVTGSPFHWALVDTYGGVYDVVIDPRIAPELPRAGSVISGTFWLSGRVVAYPN